MNIVVLSHRLPFPPNKGEKIRTYHQLEYFRRTGCQINLFCPITSDEELSDAKEYEAQSGIRVITERAGIRHLTMLTGLLSARSLSVSNFYNRKLQTQFNEHCESHSVDAIYCTSSAMAEYVFRAGLITSGPESNTRLVVDFMDLDSDKWRQYREVNRFPLSLIYRYEEMTLGRYESLIQSNFDACVLISENEKKLFEEKSGQPLPNVKVVGNGVDIDAFHPPESPRLSGGTRLLFSGVMDYFPNVDAMQWFVDQVWPLVKDNHPQAELVIAGMNPVQSIVNMGNDNQISITGYVDDMLAYYHNASIFIAPFRIARGVQNKILQAFSCGLPVVTTPIGAEGIDCIDGEHCLVGSDPVQFSSHISMLIDEHDQYRTIAQNAYDLIHSKYTWDAANKTLKALLQ